MRCPSCLRTSFNLNNNLFCRGELLTNGRGENTVCYSIRMKIRSTRGSSRSLTLAFGIFILILLQNILFSTTIKECKIEYVSLTAERLEEAVKLLKISFFPYENICTALGLAKKQEAIDELDNMLINTAKDGVSVVAIDKETGRAAGAMLSKIQDKNTSSKAAYDQYIKNAKYKETKEIFEFLTKFEDMVDPFTPYDADCLMELLFLGVLPEYSKRGIGFKLCEVSLKLATELCKGINVKTSVTNSQIPLEPRPQIVTALFTTFKTQKIGRKLNFDVLLRVSYDDMHHKGKSFASIIRNESKDFTVECKKLE